MRAMLRTGWVVLLLSLAARPAGASRRAWVQTFDTEVLPERGVEIEQWVTGEYRAPGEEDVGIWWGPVIAFGDRIELALPVEWKWSLDEGKTDLDTVGAEVRWRLFSPDPEKAGPVVPLLRLSVERDMGHPRGFNIGLTAVVGIDLLPSLHAAVNLGGESFTDGWSGTAKGSAGLAYKLTEELRLGAEVWGQRPFLGAQETAQLTVGPTVSYTLSRVWLTFGVPIGLTADTPRVMPRLIWAVEF